MPENNPNSNNSIDNSNIGKIDSEPKRESSTEQKGKEKGLFGFDLGKKEGPDIKVKELTETLQRLQAEFENYQKRSSKQNDEYKVFANAKLIEELLPVLDSLEVGMQHNKELVILHEQLFGVLKKNGLRKIVVEKGKKFDHDKMECLMQEKNEKLADGAVANVLIAGYELNGKILRLAKVSVNVLENDKNKCETNAAENVSKEKDTRNEKVEEKEELTSFNVEIKKMESD